jgi:hypothetical protein
MHCVHHLNDGIAVGRSDEGRAALPDSARRVYGDSSKKPPCESDVRRCRAAN